MGSLRPGSRGCGGHSEGGRGPWPLSSPGLGGGQGQDARVSGRRSPTFPSLSFLSVWWIKAHWRARGKPGRHGTLARLQTVECCAGPRACALWRAGPDRGFLHSFPRRDRVVGCLPSWPWGTPRGRDVVLRLCFPSGVTCLSLEAPTSRGSRPCPLPSTTVPGQRWTQAWGSAHGPACTSGATHRPPRGPGGTRWGSVHAAPPCPSGQGPQDTWPPRPRR